MKKKIDLPRLLNVIDLAYDADMRSSDLYEKLDGRAAWTARELKQVRAVLAKHAKETAAMLEALDID